MFGCSDGERSGQLPRELAAHSAAPERVQGLGAHDAVDADALGTRYEVWHDAHEPAPADASAASPTTGSADGRWTSTTTPVPLGRTHVIPSTPETVVQGLFDPSKPPVATIDSGDVLVYENTWTHFLNRLQPGVTTDELAAMRRAAPDRGVHSIVGPVAVRDAQPGDVLQLRMLRFETLDFGANFHNPGVLGTGALPDAFEHGHVQYFDLAADERFVAFSNTIRLAMKPFQGTIGVAPPGPAAVSSVAPGRFGGNLDLKDLTAGASLFVPVFHPGGLIFSGDSHALQGDGEVNITAIETGMREARLQVILHKNVDLRGPFAETPTHWIALGLDADLNVAVRDALRETIAFLHARAGLSRDQAYSLASLAVDFRVTQIVNVAAGVHALIPKDIFAPDYRRTITAV